MILCCTTCGNSFYSDFNGEKCNYCFNDTDILITNEELKSMSKKDIPIISKTLKEKYKTNNPKFNLEIWNTRESKDNAILLKEQEIKYNINLSNHKITTGYSFDGYRIVDYLSVISGNVVVGTGFLSEFVASIDDFLGTTSTPFENKIEKIKEVAVKKLIEKSAILGGNAIIGVDFDFFTLNNNMMAVSANGTSVIIE